MKTVGTRYRIDNDEHKFIKTQERLIEEGYAWCHWGWKNGNRSPQRFRDLNLANDDGRGYDDVLWLYVHEGRREMFWRYDEELDQEEVSDDFEGYYVAHRPAPKELFEL